MRRLFVPEELTPSYLAEISEIPLPIAEMLQGWGYPSSDPTALSKALSATESIFAAAWGEHDRTTAALVRLYQADLLQRQERWEEALAAVQEASTWLKIQVSQVARYNEAVAHYFEGLLYFILYADAKATQRFLHAQAMLQEAEGYWGRQGKDTYIENCRNMLRWTAQLIALRPQAPPGEDVMIVPVYEYENQGLRIRISALAVPLITLHLPPDLTQQALETADRTVVPVEVDTGVLCFPALNTRYFALKVREENEFIPGSKVEDYLLIEMLGTTSPTAEVLLNTEQPFTRRANGRIVFRPVAKGRTEFVGIPRVLIRGEREGTRE